MKKIRFERLTVNEKEKVNAGGIGSDVVIISTSTFDCPPPDFERLTIGSGCFKPYTMNAQTCDVIVDPDPNEENQPNI